MKRHASYTAPTTSKRRQTLISKILAEADADGQSSDLEDVQPECTYVGDSDALTDYAEDAEFTDTETLAPPWRQAPLQQPPLTEYPQRRKTLQPKQNLHFMQIVSKNLRA